MTEKDAYLGFAVFPKIGPLKFKLLLSAFDSAKSAWETSEKDLISVLKPVLTKQFIEFRKTFSKEEYQSKLKKARVSFVSLQDARYPSLLKQIPNPPIGLFVKGDIRQLNNLDSRTVAIVGTRKITRYGRDVTEMFASAISHIGCVIISGLAIGVDAVAHQTALENGGKTIAVLGCGVDCSYPQENQRLYDDIISHIGCVISELPLGHPPSKGTFPSRNRIVAGMSNAVLVTEGAEDSGSLITAEYGLKFGRKVFAVPGPITSMLSKGPYKLINKGATLVTDPTDLLEKLQITSTKLQTNSNKKNLNYQNATKEERKILDIIANEPLHFDEIVRRSKMDSSQVGSLISLMEIKGILKNTEAGISISS